MNEIKVTQLPFCYHLAQCSCFLSKQRQQVHQISAIYGLESVKMKNISVHVQINYSKVTNSAFTIIPYDSMYLRYLLFNKTITLSTKCLVTYLIIILSVLTVEVANAL